METILRVAFVYVFLMVALRVMGKRESGQLAPFDLVVLLLIPEFFSQAVAREDFSMTNAVIAVGTLLTLVFATSVLAYRFRGFGKVVAGSPSTLVSEGYLIPEHMGHERIGPDEIHEAMHASGLQQMSQVKWVILETDGRLAVVPWDQLAPVTPDKQKQIG